MKKGLRFSDAEAAEFNRLLADGKTVTQIAKALGRPVRTIQNKINYNKSIPTQWDGPTPSRAGERLCIRCRVKFFSEDKRAIQICDNCKNSLTFQQLI